MHLLAYATVLVIPLLSLPALVLGGVWSWSLPLVIFGLVPLAELFLPGSRRNYDQAEEARRRSGRGYDLLLYLSAALLLAIAGLMVIKGPALPWPALLGATLSVGICFGAIGMNVAHELGHRAEVLPRTVARLLLVLVGYPHFRVEHNRGHHARVATPEDPATARRGESLYPFWWRSITGGLRSGWSLERQRLDGAGRSVWSMENEVLTGFMGMGMLWALVGLLAGPVALGMVLGSCLVAVLLLETVNYVEHYGLGRASFGHGRYERTQPRHSWNSERPIGRVLLFELTRHSDHHAYPARPYAVLRHHEEAPELPTGYPGMILLALVPPLYRRVMERALGSTTRAAA